MSIKLTQMVISVLELTAFKGFKQESCYGVQVWIFEHLAHPMLSFVLGIFEIKGIKTQTKILFSHLKEYIGLQQTCTTFHVLKVFQLCTILLISCQLKLTPVLLGQPACNTFWLKGKKIEKLDGISVRIPFLQFFWSLGLQYYVEEVVWLQQNLLWIWTFSIKRNLLFFLFFARFLKKKFSSSGTFEKE